MPSARCTFARTQTHPLWSARRSITADINLTRPPTENLTGTFDWGAATLLKRCALPRLTTARNPAKSLKLSVP